MLVFPQPKCTLHQTDAVQATKKHQWKATSASSM